MQVYSGNHFDYLSAYGEAYFESPYTELRSVLSEDYQNASPQRIERVLRENLGDVSPEAMEDFLATLAQIGQAVLPVLLPAMGTVVGGPIGGVVGGVAGQAASGAIGAATAKKKSAKPKKKSAGPPGVKVPKTVARQTPTPPAPTPALQPITVPAVLPGQIPPGPAGGITAPVAALPAGGNAAAGQLLGLVLRPEFTQALVAMMLGQAGRDTIPVGGTDVPVGAFANLLGVLADQVASEHHALAGSRGEGVPEYLVESDGQFKCDISSPEERAGVLWELLQADYGDDAGDDLWMGYPPADPATLQLMQEQLFDPYALAEAYAYDEDDEDDDEY